MKSMLRKLSVFIVLAMVMFVMTGCDNPLLSNLQKGDKAYNSGDYQKAMEYYKAAAAEYQKKLGKTYSDKTKAESDANSMIEAYFKAGLTAEKLANSAEARAMFEKAVQNSFTVKESYYEQKLVDYPAGYYDRWVPGYYTDVWVDGYYEDVYKDGYYKEVYNDSTGRYDQVWVDGGYEKKYVDGHYDQKYVDGRYEKVWEAAHSKYEDIYKERDITVNATSSYSAQAKEKVGTTEKVSSAASNASVSDNSDLKAAQEAMNLSYQNYVKAGAKESGAELDAYKAASEKYQKLLTSTK